MSALEATVQADLPTTRRTLEDALAANGFGVLSEIDIRVTLAKKLDVEHEPHVILGVCNPQLAKQALDVDRDVALLLPCTVTLRQVRGGTEVRILDPARAFTLADADVQNRLEPVARDAQQRLEAVMERVSSI